MSMAMLGVLCAIAILSVVVGSWTFFEAKDLRAKRRLGIARAASAAPAMGHSPGAARRYPRLVTGGQ